jgi:hypothetical protein
MNAMRCFLLIIMLLSLGCDSVTITEPFGDTTVTEQLRNVAGRWSDEKNNIFELRISKSNELIAGHLTWDDKSQQFVGKSEKVNVRTAENAIYIFVTDKETTFFRVEGINDGKIILYIPQPKSFREAVDAGLLTGSVTKKENDHFHVNIKTDAKLQELLASKKWKDYYYPDTVVTFKKVPAAN